MSNPGDVDSRPVADVRALAAHLESGCKPKSEWRIGTEHEKFGFFRDRAPVAYETVAGRAGGIGSVLEGLASLGGWERIEDRGRLIALKAGMKSVSLEPGGQLELSGAPLADLHATAAEMAEHFAEVRKVAGPMGIGFAPLGFHPVARLDAMPMMPKRRYEIMRAYMPKVGTLGLDMMFRTCTVQVNLDFSDEADMVRKMRVASCLQPLATALFANSPFVEGRDTGFQSWRAQVWTDTDNARAGVPGIVFEEGFGFERYVDWLLDVPMYFIARETGLVDAAGASFRQWMAGREKRLAEHRPTIGDFADHSTTAFPDVRLKRILEMRGADAGSPAMMVAQSALWVGLLYDGAALGEAEAMVRDGGRPAQWVGLRAAVPRAGLDASLGGRGLRAFAADTLAIARRGLAARGLGEEALLAPLEEIASGGPSRASRAVAMFASDPGAMLEDGLV